MAIDTVHPYRSNISFGSSSIEYMAELREYELTVEMGFIDATSNDSSGWREMPSAAANRFGQGTWRLTGTCVFNGVDPQNVYNLLANLNSSTGNIAGTVRLHLHDLGSTSSTSLISGSAFLDSYHVGAAHDDIVLHDFTLRGVRKYTMT